MIFINIRKCKNLKENKIILLRLCRVYFCPNLAQKISTRRGLQCSDTGRINHRFFLFIKNVNEGFLK